ncbi:3D domain-containing protein [Carnobacterium maltaromaticum]|uniref:3D domain-containing protein n=1 Tax=Carnobacterium maltaromaticum TaxID=2751 RepID=UPI0039B0B715
MNFNKSALSTLMIFSMVFLSLFGLRASSVKADKLPNGNWEIKDGDTLSEIGLQTGLSVDIIRLLNPTTDPFFLQIGYELKLQESADELAQKQAEQVKLAEGASEEAVVAVEAATEVVVPAPEPEAVPELEVVAEVAPTNETALGTFEATYYTAFDGTQIGITANGTDVRNGQTTTAEGYRIIAADPSVLPLNTVVRVTTGNGESFLAQVCDTGGAIIGGRIDILVGSVSEATALGRTVADLTII